MSNTSADKSWAFNAKELIKEIGTRLGFNVGEEYQVDPQVYLRTKENSLISTQIVAK